MRILTSNIWGDYFGNETTGRDRQLADIYRKNDPDVIGLQEVTRGWYDSTLFDELSDRYRLIGAAVEDFVPLLIKKTYAVLAHGFAYLKNTPDVSKAVTWAVLDSANGKFAVLNTHFWWMTGKEAFAAKQHAGVADWSEQMHEAVRMENAAQLSMLCKHLSGQFACPVFAFGDLNCTVKSGVFTVFAQNGIRHLYDIAKEKDDISSHHGDPVRGQDGRFHGKQTANDHTYSIDHMVGLGQFEVQSYRVIEDQSALDATDHSPVFADITLT